MSAFDVLLFTSRWESFGLVLLEAMAAGVPIVGFDIPGANEVAINGETALLVEPYKISDLATRVLQVMSDKELYSQLSEQGKKRVEGSFSSSKNSSTVLFIYRQMLLNV